MKKFPRIADLIQTLSKGEITARHVPPFFPSIFILVGIPFIWFGGRDSLKYTESTYIFTFIGALLIITGLIILLYNNRYFIAVETRERIKPERYFLNPDECNSLIDMIHKDDINDIMKQIGRAHV